MTIARRPGEPLLGNPDADGKVLSSTAAGVRSWVTPVDQAHRDAVTGIHGIVIKATSSIGLGVLALASASAGGGTTAVGYAAGRNSTGANGSFFGANAGTSVTSGTYNSFFGLSAGSRTSTGASNVAFGAQALYENTTGGGNTAFGSAAGRYLADGTTANATPANATYLGNATKASAAGAANETVIGYNAIGGGSNTVRLGNSSVTHWLPGATNVCALGNSTTAFKELYLHDGTDEWKVTINTSGVLTTTKV